MNEQVKDYISKYPKEIIDRYLALREIIFESAPCEPEETLWASANFPEAGDTGCGFETGICGNVPQSFLISLKRGENEDET